MTRWTPGYAAVSAILGIAVVASLTLWVERVQQIAEGLLLGGGEGAIGDRVLRGWSTLARQRRTARGLCDDGVCSDLHAPVRWVP